MLRRGTILRGERASRSIVNRTTALWSIWELASLIVAGSCSLYKSVDTELPNPEEIPDHLSHLNNCSIDLDGIYH